MASSGQHASALDFSLLGGGPLFHLEQRLRLDARTGVFWGPTLRALTGLSIAWVPLFLLALTRAPNEVGGLASLWGDRIAMAQTLFAIPILLAVEPYVEGRIAYAMRRPVIIGVVGPAEKEAFDAAARRAARWRDSAGVQIAILLIAWALSVSRVYLGLGEPVVFSPRGTPLTPAGAWYLAVSLPSYWFLLLMWVWRFVIWTGLLFSLSRLPLNLIPTHADRTGGLKYLAACQASFATVIFALGCVVAAATRNLEPSNLGRDLVTYGKPQAIYSVLALAVLHLPLVAFSPKLLNAKRRSDERFSALMARHARAFERRWFRLEHRHPPLGAPDFSSQIDLSSAFDLADHMRWLPFGFRPTLAILSAGMMSLVPRLIMHREMLEALARVVPKL